MKLKINIYTSLFLMILSVFLFGYTIRVSTIPVLQYISVLFILGLTIYLKKNSRSMDTKKLILFFLYFFSTILSDFLCGISFSQWFLFFLMNTIALLLFVVKFDAYSLQTKDIFRLIRLYNKFVHLIFAIYLIDLMTGSMIMRFLADNWLVCISRWVPNGESLFTSRYASYLGHYLFTDIIYLGYYVINIVCRFSFSISIEKTTIMHIIAVIGVISTGSKTGLILLAFMLMVFNMKKIKYVLALLSGIVLLYFFGFFNILFTRLSTEEFSTGRFGAWKTLFELDILKPQLLYGVGDDFLGYICRYVDYGTAGIATEFPLLCIFFKVGIIGFFAFLSLLFLLPIKYLWRNKCWYGIICIACIFVAISTYNGLIVYPDTQILYTIIVLMILEMSKKTSYKSVSL